MTEQGSRTRDPQRKRNGIRRSSSGFVGDGDAKADYRRGGERNADVDEVSGGAYNAASVIAMPENSAVPTSPPTTTLETTFISSATAR